MRAQLEENMFLLKKEISRCPGKYREDGDCGLHNAVLTKRTNYKKKKKRKVQHPSPGGSGS